MTRDPRVEDPLDDLKHIQAEAEAGLAAAWDKAQEDERLTAATGRDMERERQLKEVARVIQEMFEKMKYFIGPGGGSTDKVKLIYDNYGGDLLKEEFATFIGVDGFDELSNEIVGMADEVEHLIETKRVEETRAVAPPADSVETGAPVVPGAPAAEPVPGARVEITPEELEALKNAYLQSKKEKEKAEGVIAWIKQKTSGTNHDHIITQYENAKEAYKRARAEYVAQDILRAIAEQKSLEQAEAEALFSDRKPGKVRAFMNYLGETSILGVDVKNTSSFFKKAAFSNRTLISAGLLAGSVFFSGPEGMAAASGTLIAAQRMLSGTGATIGVSDMIRNFRRSFVEKKSKRTAGHPDGQNLEEQEYALRSRALLDGTADKLHENAAYQEILRLRQAKIVENFERLTTPEAKDQYIQEYFRLQEEVSHEQLNKEKKWNKAAIYAGLGAGIFVGSGTASLLVRKAGGGIAELTHLGEKLRGFKNMLAERFPEWTDYVKSRVAGSGYTHGAAETGSGSGSGGSSAAEAAHAPATPPTPEASPNKVIIMDEVRGHDKIIGSPEAVSSTGNTVIEVGRKGIEGSLLELKSSNPQAYEAMIEKLKSLDPNFKGSDGGLVHRFVEKFAEDNNLNIDGGGGTDLSQISSGELVVKADGTVVIEKYELMGADHAPQVEPAAGEPGPEAAGEGLPDSDSVPLPETPAPLPVGTTAQSVDLIKNSGAPTVEFGEKPPVGGGSTVEVPLDDSSDSLEELQSQVEKSRSNMAERLAATEGMPRMENSSILKQMMSLGEYKGVLKEFAISEKLLNKLNPLTPFSLFEEKFASDPTFAKNYAGIMEDLKPIRQELGKNATVLETIVTYLQKAGKIK